VRLNLKRLVDNEPIMTEPLAEKKLAIAGGIYDIATGKVNLLT
jgi:carbonic anhydrase